MTQQEAIEEVLQRVEEGMTTAADAEFLRETLGLLHELLGLLRKKYASKLEKRPFLPKSAS